MIDIPLDFECYYDKDYRLDRLPTAEYILDPRFEIIGVALRTPDGQYHWITGDANHVRSELLRIVPDWSAVRVIAHNARFDAAILEWRLGIKPAAYFCTMVGARPHVLPYTKSVSLDAVGQYCSVEQRKGSAVANAKGKHRADFSSLELFEYGDYAKTDVAISWGSFLKLSEWLPDEEHEIMDLTLKKFVRPKLMLSLESLAKRLEEVEVTKEQLGSLLKAKFSGATIKDIRSRPKFAALLKAEGVEPPMKLNKNGDATFAFAKGDLGFKELLAHDNPRVRELVGAKMALSSTMEEGRIRKLQRLGALTDGKLPVPLVYYGAHPGRLSGDDEINLQNLPRVSIDKATKKILKGHLRYALVAPPGYSIIAADFSNIEARIVATLAGQLDLVEGFRQGRDVYSEFASLIYGRTIHKDTDPKERFVGKTCLTGETPVLCERGWVRLDSITRKDRVWDGREWVCHKGVVNNGEKEIVDFCGASLTPDHLILCGPHWKEAELVARGAVSRSQALDTGTESLRYLAICEDREEEWPRFLLDAIADVRSISSISKTSKSSAQRVALTALKKLRGRSGIGSILKRCQKLITAPDCSTALQQQLLAATHQLAVCILHMAGEASRLLKYGEIAEQNFCAISELSRDGISQIWKWIAKTTKQGIGRVTSGSLLARNKLRTGEQSEGCKQRSIVYDLLSAGPRNRFTILTDRGPVIVHNCILGLGYGMGGNKFHLKMAQEGIVMTAQQAAKIVSLYRMTYPKIRELWGKLEGLAHTYMLKKDSMFESGPFIFCHQRIILPNGMPLIYPGLKWTGVGFQFDSRFITSANGEPVGKSIWGGMYLENVSQALARIIASRAEVRLARRGLSTVLQVHDELVWVVPTVLVEKVKLVIAEEMTKVVDFLPSLPVAVEIKHGPTYGDAK